LSISAISEQNQPTTLSIFHNLQEANDKLDAIIENSFDGIYITDGDANTIKVNKAYELITGLKRDEVMGYNMRDLLKRNVISISGSLLAIQKGHPVTLHQEFKTGKKALITSSPVFDKNNNITMVITNVRDLTEIYNLKEEVARSKMQASRNQEQLNSIREKLSLTEEMVCVDENSLGVLHMANKVAALDTTVILFGETGVGKEMFAKYIYQNSLRKDKPFIKVNCGAIAPNLVESELFGYEKGAFTGANRNGKIGLFEVADKGTIFLDEIGELPLDMQVKLLRVLQEQEIERIGGTTPIKVDVRVIAATNRNLETMVTDKTFREDLYYRLMVFPITIPPLRERTDDIQPLLELFMGNFNKKYGFQKTFTPLALQFIQDYHWPGNIRELRNIVERAMILSNDDHITSEDLPFIQSEKKPVVHTKLPTETTNLKKMVEQIELEYINLAYEKYGNVRDAAQSLGMDPSTFVRKRKKYMSDTEN